ncbi:MAG: hypothetical protein ACR2NZ_09425 [Rubripirellula sp.]
MPHSLGGATAALLGAFGLSLTALLSVMTWIHEIEKIRKGENQWLAVFADSTAMIMFVALLGVAMTTIYLLLGRL